MKVAVVVLSILMLGLVALGNPYASVDPMDKVVALRAAFDIETKTFLTQDDLPLLEIFLTERQLRNLWLALADFGGTMSYREDVLEVDQIGPVSLYRILVFFDLQERPKED